MAGRVNDSAEPSVCTHDAIRVNHTEIRCRPRRTGQPRSLRRSRSTRKYFRKNRKKAPTPSKFIGNSSAISNVVQTLRGNRTPREGAGPLPALLLETYRLATFRSPTSQRRRTGSAPSKAAKDPRTRPHIGGGYALLPRDLPLLATDHIRGAFCPWRGEYGAYGSSSECARSSAGQKLPSRDCGRSPGDGQGSRERLTPDDATTGTPLLRGVRRMAAYDERSEAGSYVLLARRRWLVVGNGP
jgi:hypothetical protein